MTATEKWAAFFEDTSPSRIEWTGAMDEMFDDLERVEKERDEAVRLLEAAKAHAYYWGEDNPAERIRAFLSRMKEAK